LPGSLSFTAALVLLTFGIIEAPRHASGDPLPLLLFALALALLVLFVTIERRVARPMLDLSLFRNPRFLGAQALPLATALCYVVLLIFLPLRFVGVEGRGEVAAGLLMVPLSVPMLVVPFLGALLTRWLSPGLLSALGLGLATAGLFWLRTAAAAPDAGWDVLAWPLLLIGAGSGLPWGLMDDLAVSVVPKERAGMATGFFTTTRVAGEAIAMAAVGTVLTGLIEAQLAHAPRDQAAAAAASLATGGMEHAARVAPAIGREALRQGYSGAFGGLLTGLAVLTLTLAALSFVLLRRSHVAAPATSSSEPCSAH
jgi:Na+/melibiose symporter-like transporter